MPSTLEVADTRTTSGARIDHDERPPLPVDLDAIRRNGANERVIGGIIEIAPVDPCDNDHRLWLDMVIRSHMTENIFA
ncbi:hypothetical protein [Bradyrhizobium sp. CB2312]|uniref:hypothetical protein n=1 Tax=Bradyrhizobium sp. CB2312 TaxID=3039155 RepID=UPI0024B1DE83|nr:hypothetical protein [Bradyrhizobium sp. CB2312]WFU77257.1 hypothetical protein QA642_16980 [Bradyrhizobium sp. CB2312]